VLVAWVEGRSDELSERVDEARADRVAPTGAAIGGKSRCSGAKQQQVCTHGSGVPRPSWLLHRYGERDGQKHLPDRKYTELYAGEKKHA
jgi:hypothetical protein